MHLNDCNWNLKVIHASLLFEFNILKAFSKLFFPYKWYLSLANFVILVGRLCFFVLIMQWEFCKKLVFEISSWRWQEHHEE